ncbi:MAG: nidogen-like domain-containing protein [Lamprobacter sp.]|uniref:nidogen-like domain-containing protein n=1 Tax=Lamprobacter sp. TaxID=3100796 RepID=UPI002B25CC5A|nr:nidogen-like domain-containing protein [Lamprobacter sp.]MEA3640851.1 nidogen-like domain-containing protein [Lamprobacter sp.]
MHTFFFGAKIALFVVVFASLTIVSSKEIAMQLFNKPSGISLMALCLLFSSTAYAEPIVSGFDSNPLASGDTASAAVSLGFTANFFGDEFTNAFVNTDGNLSFGGPVSFGNAGLGGVGQSIIAPFFADVDTSFTGSGGPVTFGTGTFDSQQAFGINWKNVGYYLGLQNPDIQNSFQLILVDRSGETGITGDFDVVFNYEKILWEAGLRSGANEQGLGGTSATVGFFSPNPSTGDLFELPGSRVPGSFVDGGTNPLVSFSYNAFNDSGQPIPGRQIYEFRGGDFVNPPTYTNPPESVPEPTTLLLLGSGLLGLGFARRRVHNG